MYEHTHIHTYILGPRGSLTLAEGSRTNICFYCQVCTTWRRNTLYLIICTHIIIFPLNHEWTSKTPFENQQQSVRLYASKNIILPDEIKRTKKSRNRGMISVILINFISLIQLHCEHSIVKLSKLENKLYLQIIS